MHKENDVFKKWGSLNILDFELFKDEPEKKKTEKKVLRLEKNAGQKKSFEIAKNMFFIGLTANIIANATG